MIAASLGEVLGRDAGLRLQCSHAPTVNGVEPLRGSQAGALVAGLEVLPDIFTFPPEMIPPLTVVLFERSTDTAAYKVPYKVT